MDVATLDRQVEQGLKTLRREFADPTSASQVTVFGAAYSAKLRKGAHFPNYIPVLVYRYTREELLRTHQEAA